MKTKRFCKSTVSLILAIMMLVSMFTVGIVNAGAAETDTAQTGATITGGTTFYLDADFWDVADANERFAAYFCNGTSAAHWYSALGPNQDGYYYVTVDSGESHANIIWCRMDGSNSTNSWDTKWNQTGDLTWDGSKNLFTVTDWGNGSWSSYTPSGGGGGTVTGEFPIDFIEGERKVYLVDEAGWGSSKCYAWTKNTTTSNATWPGVSMTDTGKTMSIDNKNVKIYEYTVPAAYDMVIFYNSDSNRTNDLEFKQYNYYNNQTGVWTYKEPIKAGETEPTDPVDPTAPLRVYFRDDYTGGEIEGDDAKFFVKGNDGKVVEMTETIDVITGHILWYADVANTNTSFTFYRTSYFFDESNAASGAWNTWEAGSKGAAKFYSAQGWGSGSWLSDSLKEADLEDITNFWFGLWVDTKGNLDPHTAVRAYYKTTTEAHLYLPSYVDLSNIKLYSNYYSANLTGGAYSSAKALTKGEPTQVTLSTGINYTLKVKRTSSDTEKTVTLKVYTTSDTATMLLTTNEELYTGTTAGLQSSNAWPSNSGITSTNYNNMYKDAIETKGSIYLYGEDGALVNSGKDETKLKKIKGRGNSSFEASMRLYGKYAYNFNLDKKVSLIDGATASKKWCLLANNPDVTMMRNTFIYSLADDVGLNYGPETRLVDVFDNGKYLGAYIITEKVEYGKNTLMADMKNLDDGNTDANSVPHPTDEDADPLYEFDTDDLNAGTTKTAAFSGTNYTYKYYTTYDRPAYEDENGNTVAAASNLEYKSPENYNTKYNYLLEFELYNRYENEASWFVSSRTGQAVVVKYPEFATQAEMEWIISEFEKAEAAIYSDNTDAIKASVDVDSFARMYLIQELAINLDSAATSYYIHNRYEDDGTSKLYASPVWDYDWSLGAYAKDLKYIYTGSSVTTSENMSNPKQMFVKNKALKTDSSDNTKAANYNFQAKLVHNSYVWERCQYYWTNLFIPNLQRYIDNDYIGDNKADDGETEGRMLTEWLPRFRSSMAMNDARWGSVTYTGDDWGTKVTTDYVNRSFDFKIGNCGTSGSATKSYDNAVYYLNDWVVTRWNYMSSADGGALYNESLKETVEAKNATFTAVQEGDKLTITPSVEITYNGNRVDDQYPEKITYDIYVNGKKTTSNTLDNSTTITLESGIESNIYIVAYLTNAPNTKATSPTQKFAYGISEYLVENVTFTGEQHDAAITISPSATVTKEGVALTPDKIEYIVYVNKTAVVTKTFGEGSATVTIPEGQVSEIYITVRPVGVEGISATSMTQQFSYGVKVDTVDVTFYFKSSGSARYVPSVSVGGAEAVVMTKNTDKLIGKNKSQTQSYYWYSATVEVPKDAAAKITFTNSYIMNAVATVTVSENTTLWFGADNLNDAGTAVDLTNEEEYIRNFKLSASHMLYNEETDGELATTSINGKVKKMGDANEDNKLNVSDVTAIQRSLAEIDTLSETGSDLSDFNLDSTSSIMDATCVQIKLAN